MKSPISILKVLMPFEAATFVAAAAIHFGAFLDGYGHRKAGIAETVIAAVLLAGSALAWSTPTRARRAVVGTQAFASFGVFVGLTTIAIGVGPRTALDIAYHLAILAVLLVGLVLAARNPKGLR
jgi:heme A synthase